MSTREDLLIAEQMTDAAVTYVVAPHMFCGRSLDLAWIFSSGDDEIDGHSVVSTHQLDEAELTPSDSLRGSVVSLVYSSLPLCVCENSPCCMNNSDGVNEILAISLILCPGCLRKLQLIGAMPDVSGGLRSLWECLEEAGAGFEGDMRTLERWGMCPARARAE